MIRFDVVARRNGRRIPLERDSHAAALATADQLVKMGYAVTISQADVAKSPGYYSRPVARPRRPGRGVPKIPTLSSAESKGSLDRARVR